jgi:hypothetical protein
MLYQYPIYISTNYESVHSLMVLIALHIVLLGKILQFCPSQWVPPYIQDYL